MESIMIRCRVFAIHVLAFAGVAAAQDLAPGIHAIGASERMHAMLSTMPEGQLKQVNLNCARESSQRRLSPEEALPCSIAFGALLKRGFDGDIDRLIAWWRVHRDEAGSR
ncbi:MAG: hypothetical protein NDJ19_15900 [Ramlibacter sp.]|nr:hypothetical protein [Ramlibacter sp.]